MDPEREMLRARAAAAIAEADAMLEERAARLAGEQHQGPATDTEQQDQWRWPTRDPLVPERQPAPVRQRRPEYRDWPASAIQAVVDQRVAPALAQLRKEQATVLASFADELGAEVAKLLDAERFKWRAEIAALEKRCAGLKKRLAALEQAEEKRRAEPAPRMMPRVA
jgi:hypothetical protein